MADKSSNRRAQLRAQQEAAARQQRNRRMIGIGAVVVVVILVAVFVTVFVQDANRRSAEEAAKRAAASGATPTMPANAGQAWAPLYAGDKSGIVVNPQAKADAPVVDVYLDFQCSHCRTFEEAFGPEIARLAQAGDFKFVYHNLTFMERNAGNTSSTRPAIGAVCASNYGVYQQYVMSVFNAAGKPGSGQGNEAYSDKLLRETIPGELGFTGDLLSGFQKCYDDKAPATFLGQVTTASNAAQVQGTPTVRVNGKELDLGRLPQDPAQFATVLNETAAA